tara:strand:+ start:1261 stop:2415 length:1155 start_codon:yes stop_codon:yes gene_type:complete
MPSTKHRRIAMLKKAVFPEEGTEHVLKQNLINNLKRNVESLIRNYPPTTETTRAIHNHVEEWCLRTVAVDRLSYTASINTTTNELQATPTEFGARQKKNALEGEMDAVRLNNGRLPFDKDGLVRIRNRRNQSVANHVMILVGCIDYTVKQRQRQRSNNNSRVDAMNVNTNNTNQVVSMNTTDTNTTTTNNRSEDVHMNHAICAFKHMNTLYCFNPHGYVYLTDRKNIPDDLIWNSLKNRYECDKVVVFTGHNFQATNVYGTCMGFSQNFGVHMFNELLKMTYLYYIGNPSALTYTRYPTSSNGTNYNINSNEFNNFVHYLFSTYKPMYGPGLYCPGNQEKFVQAMNRNLITRNRNNNRIELLESRQNKYHNRKRKIPTPTPRPS